MPYPCPFCGAAATLSEGCRNCGRAPDPEAAEVIRLSAELPALAGRAEQARRAYEQALSLLRGAEMRRDRLAAMIRARVAADATAHSGARGVPPVGAPAPTKPTARPAGAVSGTVPGAAPGVASGAVPGAGPAVVPGAVPGAGPAVASGAVPGAGPAVVSGAQAVPVAALPAPGPLPAGAIGHPARATRPETSTRTLQVILFVLGGLLLGTASIVFTAVAWATFGVGGRAAILATLTGLALAAPPLALRRKLVGTAETFAAIGLLLVVLDGYAAWYVDLFGVAHGSASRYAAGVCAVTAAVAAGYGVLTGLVGPRFVVLAAVQPVVPLLVGDRDTGPSGPSFVFAAVAAINLAWIAIGQHLPSARRAAIPAPVPAPAVHDPARPGPAPAPAGPGIAGTGPAMPQAVSAAAAGPAAAGTSVSRPEVSPALDASSTPDVSPAPGTDGGNRPGSVWASSRSARLVLRGCAWALYGVALLLATMPALGGLVLAGDSGDAAAAGAAMLVTALVFTAGSLVSKQPHFHALAGAACVLAVAVAAARFLTITWPGLTIVLLAGVAAGLAGTVTAGGRVLPSRVRVGPWAAALAVTVLLALVALLGALAAAGSTMLDAVPAFTAHLPTPGNWHWQRPAALILVAGALAVLLPARVRTDVLLGGGVLLVLVAPAAAPLAWWVPSALGVAGAAVMAVLSLTRPLAAAPAAGDSGSSPVAHGTPGQYSADQGASGQASVSPGVPSAPPVQPGSSEPALPQAAPGTASAADVPGSPWAAGLAFPPVVPGMASAAPGPSGLAYPTAVRGVDSAARGVSGHVTGGDLDVISAALRAALAGALAGYAVVAGLGRFTCIAGVLAGLVAVGLLTAGLALRWQGAFHRAVGGSALVVAMLAGPGAVAAGLAAARVEPWWVARATLGASAVLVAVLALLGWGGQDRSGGRLGGWARYRWYAFAAALGGTFLSPVWAVAGRTEEPGGVYAAVALLLIAAAVAVMFRDRRAGAMAAAPAAVAALLPALWCAVSVLPALGAVLVQPYAWTGSVWTGRTAGTGLAPDGGIAVRVPAVLAFGIAVLAVTLLVAGWAGRRAAVRAALPLVIVFVPVACAAAGLAWPGVPAVSLLLGLAALLAAALTPGVGTRAGGWPAAPVAAAPAGTASRKPAGEPAAGEPAPTGLPAGDPAVVGSPAGEPAVVGSQAGERAAVGSQAGEPVAGDMPAARKSAVVGLPAGEPMAGEPVGSGPVWLASGGWRVAVGVGALLAGPGLAGTLPERGTTLGGLALCLVAGAVAGVAGRTVPARVAGWLVAVPAGLLFALASAAAAGAGQRVIGYAVLGAAALALALGAFLRLRSTSAGQPGAAGWESNAQPGAAGWESNAQPGAAGSEPVARPGTAGWEPVVPPGPAGWEPESYPPRRRDWPRPSAVEATVVESAAHAGAVTALLFEIGSAGHAAAVCTLWGVVLGLRALLPGEPAARRLALVWVGAGVELLAWWLLMAAVQVAVLEAYTLPAAATGFVAGWLALRRRPDLTSWQVYGPALAAALLPTLGSVLVGPDQPVRRLLLGVGAFGALLLGVAGRRQAPVVLGGAVLAVVALHELVLIWDLMQRWIPLAVAGLILVWLAMTLERRRRDLARLRDAVGRMT